MTPAGFGLAAAATLVAAAVLGLAARHAHRRGLGRWLVTYAVQARKRRVPRPGACRGGFPNPPTTWSIITTPINTRPSACRALA